MTVFRNILVPVDFSAPSERSIRLAADIARQYEAPITLVHVFDPVPYALPEGFALTRDQHESLVSQFERHLTAAQQQALTAGAPIAHTKLLEGSPPRAIVDFAKSDNFDLIVIASHGWGGLRGLVMGSVTEKVARTAHCPVLVIKAP